MLLRRTKIYQSFSSEETKKLGGALAKRIVRAAAGSRPARNSRGALVFALNGDLGAGKTTFAQGFLNGLKLKSRASSPTFIIMRRHPLRRKKYKKLKNIFHMDAYRLKKTAHLTAHLAALGFKEILADPRNIVLIEWADRVKTILPKDATWLTFRHGKKENQREITITRKERLGGK